MDPARVQGLKCRRDLGTRLQSYIRPAYRALEPWALMDFRALPSLSVLRPRGPWVATESGSAGPTGSPSASHNIPYATSARANLSVSDQLTTSSCALRALLT